MRLNHFFAITAILLFGAALAFVARFTDWWMIKVVLGVLFTLSVATMLCLLVESQVTPTLGYLFGAFIVSLPAAVAVSSAATGASDDTVFVIGGMWGVLGAVMLVFGVQALLDYWELTDPIEVVFGH